MIQPPTDLRNFESLAEIVKALRNPVGGCPWDLEQSNKSLAPFAIEEAFELAEALEDGTDIEIIGELGDLLLQVFLNSEIARQENRFDLPDVVEAICKKMVRRHPHVFTTGVLASNSTEVLTNWAAIKRAEKEASGVPPTHGFDVPTGLPALVRAQKIGDKTKDVGFDWSDWQGTIVKVDEEFLELREACVNGTDAEREHELGDLLFSVVQTARHLGLDAEQCLRSANSRFEKRYIAMRTAADHDGVVFASLAPAEMEERWQRVKQAERGLHPTGTSESSHERT